MKMDPEKRELAPTTLIDKYLALFDASNPGREPGDTAGGTETLTSIGCLAVVSKEQEGHATPARKAEASALSAPGHDRAKGKDKQLALSDCRPKSWKPAILGWVWHNGRQFITPLLTAAIPQRRHSLSHVYYIRIAYYESHDLLVKQQPLWTSFSKSSWDSGLIIQTLSGASPGLRSGAPGSKLFPPFDLWNTPSHYDTLGITLRSLDAGLASPTTPDLLMVYVVPMDRRDRFTVVALAIRDRRIHDFALELTRVLNVVLNLYSSL
ncbi:hypothetical protein BJY52DRAFT_1418946, partial [Lactarius psammicola]